MIDIFQVFTGFNKLYGFMEMFSLFYIGFLIFVGLVGLFSMLINLLFVKGSEFFSKVSILVVGASVVSSSQLIFCLSVMNFLVFPYLFEVFWV